MLKVLRDRIGFINWIDVRSLNREVGATKQNFRFW